MKRRVAYFLLCLCFCFSTLSSSFSAVRAVEENNILYEYDEQGNVIAEYYTYHEDYDFRNWYGAPESIYDPDRGPMMYAASKSNYSWRPSSINWASFPSYVRAIAYSPYSNISWPDDNGGAYPNQASYRAPFIMITSNGTNYTVRAGWDVALWYRESTGNTTIAFNKTSYEKLDPVLYMATFKCSDNSVVTAWKEVSYDTWGTSGQFHNFPGTGIGVSDKLDVFTYGANAFITNNAVLASVKLTDTENVTSAPYNKGRGILDHAYCGFPASFYNAASSLYFSTFTPAAPNDYTVSGSSSFGITSKMITNEAFIFHENLPYGLNSLVFGFTKNSNNTYHVITDSTADVIFLRNWNWSDNSKFQYTVLSSAPIYRIAYSATSGGYASMSSASGLTSSDYSANFSDGTTSWHSIVKYYIDKGYHAYWYSIEGNNAITISNNSTRLIIDDSLSFAHSYGAFPTADTLSQFLMNEQNSKLDEQNSLIDEGNETGKNIWDTLKEMFEKLKSLPSDIANSIKQFFTDLGDRISGFFTDLKNKFTELITGLGDRISNFFDNLAEKIKSFFLPSEDFFYDYVFDYQYYFAQRFGLLYEIPQAIIDILQQFIDYSPAESGYSITFPEVVMPVLDNGEWYDRVIIEETDITFEFLEQGPFKTLYSMYRSVVWMIFIFALINLIIRKSEKVIGGSG